MASRLASMAVHTAVKPDTESVATLLRPAVREGLEPPSSTGNSYTCMRFGLNCGRVAG